MTDDLYERYKEALRTGHVGVLRGALEEALAAYRVAAEIAPSRALPHTSLGGVYMRLGHLEDALIEYAAAVTRSPHDEGALLGQAEALTAAGMHSDAAAALDHVAEIQEAGGRLPEAADTLRRAVELEEAPDRIRRQRALLREIRFSAGDHAAEQLLARALRLRDDPAADAVRDAASVALVASQIVAEAPVQPEQELKPIAIEAASEPLAAGPEPVVAAAAEPEPVAAELEPALVEPGPVAAEPELELEPVAVALSDWPIEPDSGERPSVGVMKDAVGLPVPAGVAAHGDHQATGDELMAAAEAAELAGDANALRSLLLGTARAYAVEGRFEAGLDATHRLLQRAPGDVDAHLVLVDLYVARGWDGLAADKLRLLGRLAELNNDEETRKRLCAVATRAFPTESSLEHLCA